MSDLLSIGEVSARSGMASSAIRFYDREGLIHAERTESGQRRFRRDVLRRIAFIRIAQRVGLSLEEIRDALSTLPTERAPNRSDWQRITRGWRTRIDQRISILQAMRSGLTTCIGCGCLSLQTCQMANPDDAAAGFGAGPQYLAPDL